MRIGHGIDFHRFCEGRPLRLGGVTIPYKKGLAGHSDADVLLHALCDALLGAMGEGDIGLHFPDCDMSLKEIDSTILLKRVMGMMGDRFSLSNVDLTLMGERPKISPWRDQIRRRLAELLGISISRINLKATTTEKMGALGREEGLSCVCTILLEEKDELL